MAVCKPRRPSFTEQITHYTLHDTTTTNRSTAATTSCCQRQQRHGHVVAAIVNANTTQHTPTHTASTLARHHGNGFGDTQPHNARYCRRDARWPQRQAWPHRSLQRRQERRVTHKQRHDESRRADALVMNRTTDLEARWSCTAYCCSRRTASSTAHGCCGRGRPAPLPPRPGGQRCRRYSPQPVTTQTAPNIVCGTGHVERASQRVTQHCVRQSAPRQYVDGLPPRVRQDRQEEGAVGDGFQNHDADAAAQQQGTTLRPLGAASHLPC